MSAAGPLFLRLRRLALPAVLLLAWLASGFFIVRGNEQAVVRRFGRLDRHEDGEAVVRLSGLRWDLPWPLATVDRVNTREIRTLSVGLPEYDAALVGGDGGDFLQPVDPARQSQFLTGDRNILNLQVTVHYRVGDIGRYRYSSAEPETRLRLLVESLVADTVTRCGVDFVHVHGRNRLRALLRDRVADTSPGLVLGLEVEDVTVGAVYPPTQVKRQFLEVMNARAERQTHINNAIAYAQKRRYEQEAEKERLTLAAEGDHSQTREAARGQASRFTQLVTRIRRESDSSTADYDTTRRLAMRRMYLESMQEIFSKVAAKVLLDSGSPVDLTIFGSGRP